MRKLRASWAICRGSANMHGALVLACLIGASAAEARVVAVEIFANDKDGNRKDQATVPPELKDKIPAADVYSGHDRGEEGIKSLADGDILIFNCHGSRYAFKDDDTKVKFQDFWHHFNRDGNPPRLKAVVWLGCMWDPTKPEGGPPLRPGEADRWRQVLNADYMFAPKSFYFHPRDRGDAIRLCNLIFNDKFEEAMREIRGQRNSFVYAKEGPGDESINSIVFLIDASGSMEGAKIQSAKNTAVTQIKRLDEKTEVAVISFHGCGGGISVISEFKTLTPANKSVLATAIGSISAGGDTNLGEATDFAGAYVRSNGKGARRTLIFLSDGEETCNGKPADSVRRLNP